MAYSNWQTDLAEAHGLAAQGRAKGATRIPHEMGKWEVQYAGRLALLRAAGEVLWYSYEPIKINLGDRCTYTPDFLVQVQVRGSRLEVHEVKGYEREDSIVKFKAAARALPMLVFRMWTMRGGVWVQTRTLNG